LWTLQLAEVRALLHLDERAPARVLHHRDPLPRRLVAEQLGFDRRQEHDLGADRRERSDRRVAVVGFLPADRAVAPVRVLRDLPVLHQIDHPHRTVVVRRGAGESGGVVEVDRPVPHGQQVPIPNF
jgi:hypothetical protein